MAETTYLVHPELERDASPVDPPQSKFIKWDDVVATPEYEAAPDGRRLKTFENWNQYALGRLQTRLEEAPEEEKVKFTAAIEDQKKWAAEKFSELSSEYSLGGRLTKLGDDLSGIREFLKNPQALEAEGYDPAQVDAARKAVFEANRNVFRAAIGAVSPDSPEAKVDYNDPTLGEYGQSQKPQILSDAELEEKFWQDPSSMEVLRSSVNQLATQSIAVTMRWMSGISDAMDRWGWVIGSDTSDAEFYGEKSAYASMAESMDKTMREAQEQGPLDPRIGPDAAAAIQGITQMPAQLIPYMAGGPALGALTSWGQLYKENLDRGLEDEKFIAFENAKAAGTILPGQSYEDWEKRLSEKEIEDFKGAAAGRAALLAIPQTGVEYFQNLFLLGRFPVEKLPGGKVFGNVIANSRRAMPRATLGGLVAANIVAKGATEGAEEIVQQASSNLMSGLVRQDFAGGERDPSIQDPEAKATPLLGMPWSDNKLFEGSRQSFIGGFAGGGVVGGGLSTPKVFQEARTFEWARSLAEQDGKAFEERQKVLDAVKEVYGEDSTQYKQQQRNFEAVTDEAHWVLRQMADPAGDETRAERAKARFEADKTWSSNFAKWAQDNEVGFEAPGKIREGLNDALTEIQSRFASLRQSLSQNGMSEAAAAVDAAQANEEKKALEAAEERSAKATEALNRFIGSAESAGPGRADYARTVLTRMFPNFAYTEDFKNDDLVVGVLDAYEAGQLPEGADVGAWLLETASQVEDNAVNQNAKDQTQSTPPVSGETIPATGGTVQGAGTGVPGSEAGSAAEQAAPEKAPIAITLRTEDGSVVADEAGLPVQMTDRNFFDEYQSIFEDLSNEEKALTPERVDAHLKDVGRLVQFIDSSTELTDEQKAGWRAPFEGLKGWLEEQSASLQQGPSDSQIQEQPEQSGQDPESVSETPAVPITQTIETQQPVLLGQTRGTLVAGDEGKPLFRPDDGSPDIELRLREESVEKDPQTLGAPDFGTETDSVVPVDTKKRFSVLPPNDPGVLRPVFAQTNPATAAPAQASNVDVAAISARVTSQPEQHIKKDGRKTLFSREAAVAAIAAMPENSTRKEMLAAGKMFGIPASKVIQLARLSKSPEALDSVLRGDFDAELGLFEASTVEEGRAPADSENLNEVEEKPEEVNEQPEKQDDGPGSTFTDQSPADRWVSDSLSALEAKLAELQGPKYAALKEKLATEEGRADLQRGLAGIFNKSVSRMLDARGVQDPVIREETIDRILRGAASQTNPQALTQSVLGDLLANTEATGDPFRTPAGTPYSAWLARGRNQVAPAFQAQGRRDRGAAPGSDPQFTEDAVGEGRRLGGGRPIDMDPERAAAKEEYDRLKFQATQDGVSTVAEQYADEFGESVEDTRLALAHILQSSLPKNKNTKNAVDPVALGWKRAGADTRVKQTVLRKFKGREGEALGKLVGALRQSLDEAARFAKEEGLLSSAATVDPDDFSIADFVGIGIAGEVDAEERAGEARKTKSLKPLLPSLEKINSDPAQRAALRNVLAIELNDGQPLTDSTKIANLTREDIDKVLNSELLPKAMREVLSAATEIGGDPLRYVAENSRNEGFRRLAEIYADQRSKGPVRGDLFFNIALLPNEGTAQGLWSPDTNTAQVSPFLTGDLLEATVLHEAMHPIWDWKIKVFEKDAESSLLTSEEKSALTDLLRLRDLVEAEALERIARAEQEGKSEREIARMRRDLLGNFSNRNIKLSEFLNETLNHKPFQDFLAELKDEAASAGEATLLQRVVNAIIRLIAGKNVALDSVLQKSFEVSVSLSVENRTPGLDTKARNALQAEYFRDVESQLGKPVSEWTEDEFSNAAMSFALAYPNEAAAAATSTSDDFAPGALSPGELSSFEELAAARERRASGITAVEFVSPNDADQDLDFSGAIEALADPKQAELKDFGARIHRILGLPQSRMIDALGDWADGAEPTTITEHFDADLSYEDLRVIAALKGAKRNQKAVIPFKADDNGEQFLYDFSIPGSSLVEARDILGQAGIQFRTLIEQNGGVRVLIFDPDGSAFDAFASLVTQNNYEATITTGTGEFLGSWDSRDEGREIYARTIAEASRRFEDEDRQLGPESTESLRAARLRDLAKEAGLALEPAPDERAFAALAGEQPNATERREILESAGILEQFETAANEKANQTNEQLIRNLNPDDRIAGLLRAAGIRDKGSSANKSSTGLRGLPRQLRLSMGGPRAGVREAAETDRRGNVFIDVAKLKASVLHQEGSPEYRRAVGFVLGEELIHHIGFQVEGFDDAVDSVRRNPALRKFVAKALTAYFVEDEAALANLTPAALTGDDSYFRTLGFAEAVRMVAQNHVFGDIRENVTGLLMRKERAALDKFKAELPGVRRQILDGKMGRAAKAQLQGIESALREKAPAAAPQESAAVLAADTYLSGFQELLRAVEASEVRSFKEKSKFLTAPERDKFRADTRRTFLEIYKSLPSEKEFAAVALGGQAKRGWYESSTKALIQVFGADAPRFAALLAATSPQQSVENNLTNALNIWKNWKLAPLSTDPALSEFMSVEGAASLLLYKKQEGSRQVKLSPEQALQRWVELGGSEDLFKLGRQQVELMGASVYGGGTTDSVLDGWVGNSLRALNSEFPEDLVISGPKVNSFMLNLRGVVDEVTNDAWMANFALVDQNIFSGKLSAAGDDPGKRPGYLAMSARVRAAADYLTKLTGETWTPAEVQETVWSWAKTLYELQERKGETRSALDILQAGEVTDEAIAATPDFATLLNDGDYRQILTEAGYGEALDGLAGLAAGSATAGNRRRFAPEANSAAAQAIRAGQENAARRLTKLFEIRQKERDQKKRGKAAPSESAAVLPASAPGFTPSVFGASSRKVTTALQRVINEPEFAPLRRALEGKNYISWAEEETKAKALEFIDVANGGDLNLAFLRAKKGSGLTSEQVVAVQGLVVKRAQEAANAAREQADKLAVQISGVTDEATKEKLYQKASDLLLVNQLYQDMAESFAEEVMENASAAGSELRAYRMLADIMAPRGWARQYKAAIAKTQKRKLEKDRLAKEITSQVRAARQKAADTTAKRIEKALAIAAKRFMPKDATPNEVAAAELLARELAADLPVRQQIVDAAVADVVVQGVETIRRTMTAGNAADPSFLEAWEQRLQRLAAEQIDALIEERLQAGTVAAPQTDLTPEEQEQEKAAKLQDIWRSLGDLPLAETVFNLAKSEMMAADTPYKTLLNGAKFDGARSSLVRKAVRSSVRISDEVRKTAADQNASIEALQAQLGALNPSLTSDQRANLAEAIKAVYDEEVQKEARAALERIVRSSNDARAPKVLNKRTVEDLMPLVNMGAFSDEAAYNAIAEKFGLPVWDPAIAAEIEAEAETLQALPEGSYPRLEAAQRLGLRILKANIKASKGFAKVQHLNQIASAIWTASVLSGPPTQIVNAGMTTVSVFLESFMEAVGHAYAAKRAGASHQQAFEFFKDIGRSWKFAFGKTAENTSVRAISEVFSALTTGLTRFKTEKMEDMAALEMFNFDESAAIPGNAMMEAIVNKEWLAAAKEGGKASLGIGAGGFATLLGGPVIGLPVAAIENVVRRATGEQRQGALRAYGANMKLVGRLMAAADAVNSTSANSAKALMMKRALMLSEGLSEAEVNKRMKEIAAGGEAATRDEAIQTAEDEAARGDFGPPGTAAHRIAKSRRIEQLIEQQTFGPEILNNARDFASLATFNSDPYGMVGAVMVQFFGGMNRMFGMGTKPINPFPKTISNLINAALNYTPYGSFRALNVNAGRWFLSEESKYHRKAPEPGTPESYSQHARAIAGTIFLVAVAYMLRNSWEERKKGNVPLFEVHGIGPGDRAKRRQWADSGAKAFTLRAGGASLRFTDWPGVNLVLGALGTVYDSAVFADVEQDPTDRLFSVLASVAGTTLNRNMLGGAGAIFDVLSQATSDRSKQAAFNKLASSYVGGFSKPSITRWIETVTTGTYQENRTQAGFLLSMMPIVGPLRDKPARNILGEPVEISAVDATVGRIVSTQKVHPVLTPLTDAQLFINPPERYKIADLNAPAGARNLNETEFYKYANVYGREVKARLTPDRVRALTRMAQVNPQAAQDSLNELTRYARDAAQAQMRLTRAPRK